MADIQISSFDEFKVGEIISQRIDFSIKENRFLMLFTPVKDFSDAETLASRSREIGFTIPDACYEIKFDRLENFESENFYEIPSHKLSLSEIRHLGKKLVHLLEFHCQETSAEAYLAVAERPKLRSFYDRLAKNYADTLQFEVLKDLEPGGFGYAIRTYNFRGKGKKN